MSIATAAAQPRPKPQTVETNRLRPNPHNPRMLFDADPMLTLKESIQRVGILVPLTVYRAEGSEKFTILDGQRRWTCATALGMPEVPINEVPEPSLTENIVTMFQIHKLRKDWELMPTALKLGVLMDHLDEKRESVLASLTGLDTAVVTRCKKLLTFEPKYHDKMLHPDPGRRLQADLFIEMYPIVTDRSVVKADWFNRVDMIESFIRKHEEKLSGFKAVTDFRKIKAYLTAARKADREDDTLNRLRDLVYSDHVTIADLEVDEARIHSTADGLIRSIVRLRGDLMALDVDEFAAEDNLWREMEDFLLALKEKLLSAERRPV
ncbi:ParB N-terminal domain-containing protein [Brevundimonas sp. SPF441]|uniref:ParB/RepB/Spo0J family partition protein n=1 Tax=Brevundimonas sp. SPF441 TaxID=2663795 RepID=UPI001892B2C4|nr:ParB N-terminal domain-containing protein [Brevundimonas sp. SPF441]